MHDIDLLGATKTTTANQRRGGESVDGEGQLPRQKRRSS